MAFYSANVVFAPLFIFCQTNIPPRLFRVHTLPSICFHCLASFVCIFLGIIPPATSIYLYNILSYSSSSPSSLRCSFFRSCLFWIWRQANKEPTIWERRWDECSSSHRTGIIALALALRPGGHFSDFKRAFDEVIMASIVVRESAVLSGTHP